MTSEILNVWESRWSWNLSGNYKDSGAYRCRHQFYCEKSIRSGFGMPDFQVQMYHLGVAYSDLTSEHRCFPHARRRALVKHLHEETDVRAFAFIHISREVVFRELISERSEHSVTFFYPRRLCDSSVVR